MGDYMQGIHSLGENLKSTRNRMGLSLDEVSSMTGVSKTMLSQIERSQSVPTLATVWKIANGLKIKFEDLLKDSTTTFDIKSIDNVTPLRDCNDLFYSYCFFPFSPTVGCEFFYVVIKAGCVYSAGNHQNSNTEYFFVTQGEVELVVEDNRYLLKSGSSIAFNSKKDHTYINNGPEDVIAISVVSY